MVHLRYAATVRAAISLFRQVSPGALGAGIAATRSPGIPATRHGQRPLAGKTPRIRAATLDQKRNASAATGRETIMNRVSTATFDSTVQVERQEKSAARAVVLALLTAVVVVDQTAKWWAWRHATWAQINYGGNSLVGATLSRWYANPLSGGLLDLLDFGLLSVAIAVLLRRGRPVMVLVTGALMIGGWASNLADRLGMHYLTAPGSVRGAVDFIRLGQNYYYNVADVFIVGGTLLFLLTVSARVTKRRSTTGSRTPAKRPRLRARGWVSAIVGAACLIGAVGFGAVNYGGATIPATLASASAN
jgi:lipoprotein signal peptidase